MVNYTSQSNTLTAGGGVITLSLGRAEALLILTGSAVLTGSWSVTAPGTPIIGQNIKVLYNASLSTSTGNTVAILGYVLSTEEMAHYGIYDCTWTSYGWSVTNIPTFEGTGWIKGNKIVPGSIPGSSMTAGSVTNAILATMARASVKIGNATNVASDVLPSVAGQILQYNGTDTVFQAMSGDATISSSGSVTLASGAVTNAKLAPMARRTVKVGILGNVASDLAVGDGQIVVGNATDIAAVTPSGDVLLTNTGAMTIQPSVIDETKVTWVKDANNVYAGIATTRLIEDGELRAYLDGTTRNLVAVKAGDIIISARMTITTASGTGTDRIQVGVDSNVRPAGAVVDGLLLNVTPNVPGIYATTSASGFSTYVGSLAKIGYQHVTADGFVTITSNVNISATAVNLALIVEVMSK
jgi:hypothetical protein